MMNNQSESVGQARRIAAIGEVLWDVFETGPQFGGAPANFACSAAAMFGDRHKVLLISAVGDDDLGIDATRQLRRHQVDTSLMQTSSYVTGRVDISLDDTGGASYEFADNCAWDNLNWQPEFSRVAAGLDAVCFGTLGQRSETSKVTIHRFVSTINSKALRIFDVNIRPPFYDRATVRQSLELANVLKLNDEELPLLAEWFRIAGSGIELLQALADQFELCAIALTRGEQGAIILRGAEVSEFSGVPTTVVDTVGAGDAFTAALTYGLLAQDDLNTINRQACEVAAFVCSQAGATPQIPRRLTSWDRDPCS